MSTSKSLPDSLFARNLTPRHFMTQGRVAGLLVAVTALLGAGFMLSQPTDSAESVATDESPGLPVSIIVAEPVSSFDQTRHYTGALVARRSADVSFERAARVTHVLVDEGDTVTAGQELARLDIRRLNTRHQMLQAQRDAAAALLAELQAGPRVETIAATRAQVEELKALLELRQLTHDRTKQLEERNSTSTQAVDNSRLSMKAAVARLAQTRERLQELEAGTREEKIKAQQAVVDQLDAQLADVQLDHDESVITAPFDGRVSMRYIDEGTMASPGQAVVRVIESTAIEARIGLPAGAVSHLAADDSFTLNVGKDHYRATFARVLPQVDLQTRTRMAVFNLSAEDSGSVAPGQMVRISLSEQVEATGCWLPTAALSPGQRGLWSAYVVEEQDGVDRIESRPVEILHTEGDRVLITGTIQAGDRVVSGGVQRIVPGQLVQVAP